MDEAARAEEARKNAVVLAEIETAKDAARAERERADTEYHARLHRQLRAEKNADRDKSRARRAAQIAAVRGWVGLHVVDLLIYPLALVSALMAVPAMAAYGYDLYHSGTGFALFFITELGMWAFSIAVHVARHRYPERPVWALQVGVWAFTAAGFGVNFGHGWQGTGSVFDGAVMGLASVAGVVAHQLVTASPRRSRVERNAVRMAARVARKVARVQRAAVRAAIAELDVDGSARLVFAPGTYTFARTSLTGRCRLTPAAPPALSVSAGFTLPDTEPDSAIGGGTVEQVPTRQARKRAKPSKRKPARKMLADYVNDARASWSPGVEITPAWARRATGCSAGLSSKVAAALRDDVAEAHPAALTPHTEVNTGREAA
ncbi:hypothetical protein [Actinophytocola oryzae]|uniref:hypothetical protein n=1 Tax=Actinophytocola oryzae TaxID=502181 RepID=UPI001AAFCFCB|nr:hypothetical protein [Actinophytocola oryzae]